MVLSQVLAQFGPRHDLAYVDGRLQQVRDALPVEHLAQARSSASARASHRGQSDAARNR